MHSNRAAKSILALMLSAFLCQGAAEAVCVNPWVTSDAKIYSDYILFVHSLF